MLAVIVVVLGISGTACAQTLSGELDFPTDRDNFFHIIAVNFNAPELCGRINPRADGGGGASAPGGYQITSLQSSCYSLRTRCTRHCATRNAAASSNVVPFRIGLEPHAGTDFPTAGISRLSTSSGER